MVGKKKCKALKEIRQKIAEENDIEYVVKECQHKGECKGTCPRCEAEVRYLEQELEKRVKLGKKVAIVGISAAMMSSLVACDNDDLSIGKGKKNSATEEELGGAAETRTEAELSGDVPKPIENTTTEFILEGEPEMPPDECTTTEYMLEGDVTYIDDPTVDTTETTTETTTEESNNRSATGSMSK